MISTGRSARVSGSDLDQPYDATTIWFHWITAALVVLLWGIAQIIDFFPKGPPKIAVRSLHILLGALLAVVLLVRIYWRVRHGQRLPAANSGFAGYLAQGMHYLLYAALVATVALGLANVWVRGDTVTGLFTVRQFAPGDKALKSLIEHLHGNFANAILIAAGLHAMVALIHHAVLRDTVLRRMLPIRDRQRAGRPGSVTAPVK